MSTPSSAEVHVGKYACPVCSATGQARSLMAGDSGLACAGCSRAYPVLGGLPCLVPDVAAFRLAQACKLRDYLAFTAARRRAIESESRAPDLLPPTRERLLTLIRAMDVERTLVGDLLAPVVADAEALAGRVPGLALPGGAASLLEMYESVFRDWAWGASETERALVILERMVAAASTSGRARLSGHLAIYGAGACRLAARVHRALGPQVTYALDINPLPLLLADQLLQGDVIEAYEYPVGPRRLKDVALRQRLRRDFEVPEGLLLALADTRRPPFAPGNLDAVLTPWYIDVVDADVSETAASVNRVLAAGGLWLNQGPLRFRTEAAGQYCIEEVHEWVRRAGFEILTELTEDVPYFDSPFAGSRRTETVFGFVARKVAEAKAPRPPRADAAWRTNLTLPVPYAPELELLQERFVFGAGALSLIDGSRSITELAELLGAELRIDPRLLHEPLRQLLTSLQHD